MSDLQKEIARIQERNQRVEAEKAWEISATRIASIAAGTYVIAALVLMANGSMHPFRDALIPMIGFVLSAQSLPFLKKRWIAAYRKRHG